MSDVTAFRLLFMFIMLVMLAIMWRNAGNVSKLLKQGQEDKKAREEALLALRKTATDLATQTQTALEDANKQSLNLKIDKNTQVTIKTAETVNKKEEG